MKKKVILSSNSEQTECTFEKKKYLGCQMHGILVDLKILSSKFGTWNNSLYPWKVLYIGSPAKNFS